jgi:hypothetical protein
MDERVQLRHDLEQNQVDQAFALLDEMDEMSREVEEGVHSPDELAGRLDRDALIRDALAQIRQEQGE